MKPQKISKGRLTFQLVLWLLLGNAVSIAAIIVGALRIDMCPVQPKVPVYLIVAGSLGVAVSLFKAAYVILLMRRLNKQGSDFDASGKFMCGTVGFVAINTVISLIALGWFIAGCVWVFKVWKPNYDPTSEDEYCDQGLYLFAFVSLIIQCITIGLGCIGSCCGCC